MRRNQTAVVGLVVLVGVSAASAQTTLDPLGQQLKTLNVRQTTTHYALAGTTSDQRLNDYGKLLEAAYQQYAAGFQGLLSDAEKAEGRTSAGAGAKSTPAKSGGTTSKGKTGPTSQPAETAAPAEARAIGADDPQKRLRVIVLAQEQEYRAFTRAYLSGNGANSIGMYIGRHKVLLILDQANPVETQRTLQHEALHQFVHRYVPQMPIWLNEGLAEYYERMQLGGGQARFEANRESWKLCRKAIDKKLALSVSELVHLSHADFYDSRALKISGFDHPRRAHLNYAQAYTLVDFFLSDANGKKRLQDYIRALARARDAEAALKVTDEHFKADFCAKLTTGWEQHVKSRPETR